MDSLNEVTNKQKISVQSKLPKKTSLDQMPCFYLGGGGGKGNLGLSCDMNKGRKESTKRNRTWEER